MKRKQVLWSSLAILGFGSAISGQDWKPVATHQARYESPDSQNLVLIGKPITGRSKVDRSVEPAGFEADKSLLPLPPAPPSKSLEQQVLPFPRTVSQNGMPAGSISPGANVSVNSYPAGTLIYPNGTVVYPNSTSSNLVPQAVAPPANGQIVGAPVMGYPYNTETIPGMEVDMGGDRYYRQGIHGSPGLWYGSFDFMALSLSHDTAPSLVITGPQSPSTDAPFFSVPVADRATVFGNDLPSSNFYGGRATLGVWFNRCQTWGMFGSFFTTNTQSSSFTAGSADGSTFFGRPFVNTDPANPGLTFERVSDLAGLGGTVTVNRSTVLRGGDLNFRFNWWHNVSSSGRLQWNVDGYAGVKYMGLDESLSVTENLEAYDNVFLVQPTPTTGGTVLYNRGTTIFVQDRFNTMNNFLGGNIGIISEARMGRFFVELRTGLAIGGTSQTVTIGGNTQFHGTTLPTSPPDPLVYFPPSALMTGGLLAQSSNIGSYNRTAFSLVPDLGLKFGLQLTDHLRIFAGYDLMYWSNVVRPGKQIDSNVNTSQTPFLNNTNGQGVVLPLNGPAQPAFNFNSSNLLINGLSAGLSWVF